MAGTIKLIASRAKALLRKGIVVVLLCAASISASADDFEQAYEALSAQSAQAFDAFNKDIEAQYGRTLLQQWQSFSEASYLENEAGVKPAEQPSAHTESNGDQAGEQPTIIIQPAFDAEFSPSGEHKQSFYGHPLLPPPPIAGAPPFPELEFSLLANWTTSNLWRRELVAYRKSMISHPGYPQLLDYYHFLTNAYTRDSWAALMLAQRLCHATFSLAESVISCSWMLAQAAGFDVRLARHNNGLLLLVRSDKNWLDHPFFDLKSGRFYVFNKNRYQQQKQPQLWIHQAVYPGADNTINVSLAQGLKPAFKNIVHRRLPDSSLGIDIKLDQDQIHYLSHLPVLQIGNYLNTRPSEYIIEQLKQQIAGSRQPASSENLLPVIKWLQLLPYETDEKQFGYEKPMTIEELLYYGASDCEDRVYALSAIFRTLWGLEVAALKFPGHLSASIRLNNQWLEVDPTYLGGGFNERQPALIGIKAEWLLSK